jgi:L-amino acid N-acyltransferase
MPYTIKLLDRSNSNQILEIFNDAIMNSTALYDYKPRTMEMMEQWFAVKEKGNYPVVGVVDEFDALLAFGSYGIFRDRPAYKYTVEQSLYVHKDHRGKGLGSIIIKELISHAERQNYHCIIGGIDSTNAVSIGLHKKFGFVLSGRIIHAGFKFNQWLDLEFYQLILKTPEHPVDG